MKRKAKDVLFVNQLRGNEIVSKDRKKNQGEVYSMLPIVSYMYHSSKYQLVGTKLGTESFTDNMNMNYAKWKQQKPEAFKHAVKAFLLEPSCGSGNFLEFVLTDRIKDYFRYYRGSGLQYPKLITTEWVYFMLIDLLWHIQGIDIMLDNVKLSRERIFYIVHKVYRRINNGKPMPLSQAKTFWYLLNMTIQCANTLLCQYMFVKPRMTKELILEVIFESPQDLKERVFYDVDGFKVHSEGMQLKPIRVGIDDMGKLYLLHKKVTAEYIVKYAPNLK